MNSSGALSLGINSWNDDGGVTSNSGKISFDTARGYNNWRFFAVTYDETLASGQVKFYFGTSTSPAELDRTANYDKGPTGGTIAPSVTLGNHSTANRSGTANAAFRGLMDEIRIFGSKTNGEGALSLAMIQSLQGAAPLAGQPGLLYERWNNISGNTIYHLTSNSRFPNSPDQTLVRTTFEGFVGAGDNYGIKMSGWIEAPVTGSYVFGFTSDDAGELRLSSNANPVNKQLILSNPTWTSINTWAQQSDPIPLEAGQFYYIEALMKEWGGGDHLKVGWKGPNETEIQVIGAPALFVTPPETDAMYPSAYHLYEQGTGTKKATMGWQKEMGNSHFYIEADGHRSLKVQNGSVVVPDKLMFGGKYPNYPIDVTKGDLGFKYERTVESAMGTLTLENQAGEWAFRAFSYSDAEPHVQFNQSTSLLGPDYFEDPPSTTSWRGQSTSHNVLGIIHTRGPNGLEPGDTYVERSVLNGAGLTATLNTTLMGLTEAESTWVSGGKVAVKGIDIYSPTIHGAAEMSRYGMRYEVVQGDSTPSWTTIDGNGLTTKNDVNAHMVFATVVDTDTLHANDIVTTPKWRIVPDYVFEKDYKLRSLPETERFVREKKHLPEIPSAKEMSTKGVSLTEMNLKLLKKVEELTLHMIEMDKVIKAQQRKSGRLEQEVRALRGAGKGN